jgi:hypothetical protein
LSVELVRPDMDDKKAQSPIDKKPPDLAQKTGWAKIRGKDITCKEHMKNAGKPGTLAIGILGPLLALLLRTGGMTAISPAV